MRDVPILRDLPAILLYPLRGHALIVVLASAAILGFGVGAIPGVLTAGIGLGPFPSVGVIIVLAMVAYLFVYGFEVIRSVAEGEPHSPPWIAFRDPVDLWLRPLGAVVALGVVIAGLPVALMFLAPASLVVHLLTVLLFFISGCIWPMALIAYAKHRSLSRVLNLRFLIPSLRRALPDYYLLILIVWVVGLVGTLLIQAITLVAGLVGLEIQALLVVSMLYAGFIAGYLIILQACIAGRVYRQAEARIGWFVERPDPPGPWLSWSLAVLIGLELIHVGVGLWRSPYLLRTAGERGGMAILPWQDKGLLMYTVHDLDSAGKPVEYTVSYLFQKRGEGYVVSGFDMQEAGMKVLDSFTVNRMGLLHPEDLPPRELPIRGYDQRRRNRQSSILCGPTDRQEGDLYLNGARVTGVESWERWEVFVVQDPDLPGPLYYDRATGYLVGMDFSEGERRVRWAEILSASIPGLRSY